MAEIKNIEVGKFYLIHGGSKTGHPGFVVWKDDNANRYLLVLTESDKDISCLAVKRPVNGNYQERHDDPHNINGMVA